MSNFLNQLKTCRAYWLLHDFLMKFWLTGVSFLIFFWIVFFSVRGIDLQAKQGKAPTIDLSTLNDLQTMEMDADSEHAEESISEVVKVEEEKEVPKKVDDGLSDDDRKQITSSLKELHKRYPSRKYEFWKIVKCKLTAYTPDYRSCGTWADGYTSKMDNAYHLDGVAACPSVIPYRTGVYIPGVGVKEVDDTGGAMRQAASKGYYHIDVRFRDNKQAKKFGVQWKNIYLFKKVK